MKTMRKSSLHRSRWMSFIGCLAVAFMLAMMALTQTSLKAQGESGKRAPVEKDSRSAFESLAAHPNMKSARAPEYSRPTGVGAAAFIDEVEPNNTFGTAQPLTGTQARVRGYIQFNRVPTAPTPNDLDFYSFSGTMGDRVYAAVQTAFGSQSDTGGQTTDTVIELLGTDGTTLIESDDDEGTFGSSASTIAGAILPATGTFFIKVRHFSTTPATEILPYDLYLRLQSGSPTAESEPNNNAGAPNAPNPLPMSGWVSGAIDNTPNPPGPDNDVYSIALGAGDTVFLSLDANPERDGVNPNLRLGFGLFDNSFVVINDAATTTPPNSEAFFFTVREAGTYLIYVDAASGTTPGPTITYNLSASVFHANTLRTCTAYGTMDVPKAIGPGAAITTSTLTVPDSKKIGNLKVSLNITFGTTMTAAPLSELDVSLISPDGNEVLLFDDISNTAATATTPQIDLTLDDEAGIPIGSLGNAVYKSMTFQTEGLGRLSWFKNMQAQGTWTLRIFDDTGNTNGGTLNNWSITVCEDPAPIDCAGGATTVFTSDFEASDGMFTHTGTNDEWEWGTPTFAPITTAHSGTKCWKTDLDSTYNPAPDDTANLFQELVSPNIDLTARSGQQITFEWAMKYQVEGAHWDHLYVEAREVGGGGLIKRVFQHHDPTMTRAVGIPSITLQEAAGWGVWQADISEFGGKTVQLVFHLDNDDSINLAGFAVDDVKVTACAGGTCPTSLAPTSQSFAGNGGMNSIAVTANVGCAWMASTNDSWIHITSGSGSGNGTISYTVDTNMGAMIRSGTITINSLSFTVYQGINFLDVPANDPFYDYIGRLSARGVTLGCGGGNYCPNANVTREQMAAFILRAKGEFMPPTPNMQRYPDVPPANVFYNFIDRMAVLGITQGCGGGNYCPSDNVTREQMAAFIIRGIGEFMPPTPGQQRFADVPPANVFYNFIDRMGALNITSGCATMPLRYCPSDYVTRGQMAVFLVRAFNL